MSAFLITLHHYADEKGGGTFSVLRTSLKTKEGIIIGQKVYTQQQKVLRLLARPRGQTIRRRQHGQPNDRYRSREPRKQ